MLMAFSLGNVWGASTTYVFNSRDWEATVNEEEANWTLGLRASGYTAGQGTQITTSGTGTNATSPISFTNISSIIVTYCTNSKAGNGVITMQVGEGDEQSFTVAAPSSNGTTLKTKEFKYDPNESGNVKITVTCTKNSLYIYSIEVITADVVPTCSTEVTITPGSTTHGTFSLSDTKVCGDGEGGEISVTDISADDGYAFDEITTTNGTVDNENKKVTGITANTTITVLFKELQKYTVSFNTGAGNPSQADITETTAGAGITLPDGPTPACSADGWTFAGWAAAAVASETTTTPTLLSGKYNPTDNVTLYAVYKRTKEGGGVAFARYEKVTSDPSDWSGKYLLAANTTGTTYYTFTGQNGSNNYGSSVEHTPGTTEKAEWEVVVAKTTNGYSIYHANSSKYLGLTASSNALYFNANFTAETYEWVLSSANGAQAYSYDTRYIECNTGSSYRVACYAGTQKRFYLYKRIEEAASTTYYLSAPSCCTKLADIEGSVKSVDQTSVTLQWTKLENVDGTTPYEVVVSPNAGVSVGTINLEGEKAECAITNLACGTEYTFTIKAYGATGYCDAEQEIVQSTSKYTITPNAIGGGLVLAPEATSVCNGTEITLTANTPDGSHEGTATIVITNESKEDVTSDVLSGSTLTMPAYNITITATYAEKSSPSVGVTPAALDFGSPAKGASTEPKTFELTGSALVAGTLTLVAPTGYTVKPAQIEVEAGSLAAQTIYVTPSTEKAGVFNGNISISGAGVAETNIVALTMTVQETYTAKWFVNGEELTASTQTAVAGTDLIVPTNPTKLADDCDDMSFKGWAEAAIEGKQDNAPTYTTKTQMPEADVNFYAVFAVEKENISKEEYQYTIPVSDFNTTSYAANNNEKTVNAVCTTDESKKLEVKYTSNQVMQSSSLIQGQKSAGYIYNAAAWGSKVKSITINDNENYTYVIGASAQPTVSAEGAFFKISAGSATSKASSIDIVFEASNKSVTYTDYLTTCPSCSKVTLEATEAANGTVELSSYLVKTCEDAEVTVTTTPATGYELSNIAISELSGASISGNTISLDAETAGELTVTATFTKINYTVTLEQTGGAEAELENINNKNYGDPIEISAPAVDGYVFVKWSTSTPNVTLANDYASTTTFTMPNSNVTVNAQYAKLYTVAEAKELADGIENVAISGIISQLQSVDPEKYVRAQYFISDNGNTDNQFLVYNGYYVDGADVTSNEQIVVGDKVIVFGNIGSYNEVTQVAANNYMLSSVHLSSIAIDDTDAAKTYEAGDKFELSNVTVSATYADESVLDVTSWAEKSADPTTIEASTTEVALTASWCEKIANKNVAVTVNTHAVTFEAPTNGTLEVKNGETPINSGDAFVKGTVLTVVATPVDDNYVLTALTAGETDILGAKQFEVGTADIAVAATFTKKAEAPISWSAAEAKAYTVGKTYTLPTLTNTLGLAVTYSSETPETATISNEEDHEGEISVEADGTTVITATYNATAEGAYKTTAVSYTLTVYAPASVVVTGDATKKAYEAGETFSFEGLGAKATYADEAEYEIPAEEIAWTPAEAPVITENTTVEVTATWQGLTSAKKDVAVTVNTHAITIETPENGTLVVKNGVEAIASGDAFAKVTVLTVEAIPASANYKAGVVTVTGATLEGNTITVGSTDFTVSAVFAEKAVAELVWSKAEATAVDYEGAVNALPTLTNAASLEVAYESTNTDVAEIAANGDVTIKAAGTATIKAIFAGNETYKAATVTYELTVSHVPVVKLAGTFNDWTGALLTPNEDYTEASVKVNLTADSWPLFKMIVDEEWRGLPKDGDNYYLFHRDWNTVEISGAGDDIQLKADFEGEYTFTWTYATNTLTITFPDMPEPEYYIAGDFTSWETNMAKMTEDAGMYKATVTINATKAQEFKVVRVQGPYKTWYGLAGEATMTPDNCENWIIGGGDKNIGLQTNYAGKYTFYFVPEDMKLSIDMPTEQATALDNTEAGETAVKVMQNGQLMIMKNGKTYNAQGQIIK